MPVSLVEDLQLPKVSSQPVILVYLFTIDFQFWNR